MQVAGVAPFIPHSLSPAQWSVVSHSGVTIMTRPALHIVIGEHFIMILQVVCGK